MSLEDVERELNAARSAYDQDMGEARTVLLGLQDTVRESGELETLMEDLDKIAAILNSYADERQAKVQGQIESIVTEGLQTIFGEPVSLRIENKMVGRRAEINFLLSSEVDGKMLETSILDARGGGVASVAGFLIQATMVLLTPGLRPILFLDEAFANVSVGYEDSLSEFIAELVEKTPLQIVLVTHSTAYDAAADKVYRVSQDKGITTVKGVN